jgi:hypothetical protein
MGPFPRRAGSRIMRIFALGPIIYELCSEKHFFLSTLQFYIYRFLPGQNENDVVCSESNKDAVCRPLHLRSAENEDRDEVADEAEEADHVQEDAGKEKAKHKALKERRIGIFLVHSIRKSLLKCFF